MRQKAMESWQVMVCAIGSLIGVAVHYAIGIGIDSRKIGYEGEI